MSTDKLIYSSIEGGSSFSEQGKSAFIIKKPGESVLVFRTDSESARAVLRIGPSCDAAFLYMKPDQRPIILFCELKGRDVNRAAEQIRSTLIAVRNIVRATIKKDYPQNADVRAVIVRSGTAPRNQGKIQETFWQSTGVRLRFARERADLREFLS